MQNKMDGASGFFVNNQNLLVLIGCGSIGIQICSYKSSEKHCIALKSEVSVEYALASRECKVILGADYVLYVPFILMLFLIALHKIKYLRFLSSLVLWLGIPWLMYVCFTERDNVFRGASETILYANLLVFVVVAFVVLLNVIFNFSLYFLKKYSNK